MDLKSIKAEDIQGQNNLHLLALWHEQNGDWDKAHTIVQGMEDKTAFWIHAYLHRKEGDLSNSQYWYNKAGRQYNADLDFDEEIMQIMLAVK